MKNRTALILFLFAGAGMANAGTIYDAVWTGGLNQEWTFGACAGSNLSAPPVGNNGFGCGITPSPYSAFSPVVQTNWSLPIVPVQPPYNSGPPLNNLFDVTIGSGAGVVTLGDPAYNNCPSNNCISSSLVYVNTLNLAATSGLKIYGTLYLQQQSDGSGGTLTNSGEVILPGTQSGGLLGFVGSQPTSISGGGLITLNGGTLQSGSSLTSDNTIHGYGLVTVGGTLTNIGTINADSSAGALSLSSQISNLVNQGSILSTSTGGLSFAGVASIDNTAGVIQASDGSTITSLGTTISGGTIGLSNSGSLALTGTTITGGTLNLGAGSVVTINGQSSTSLIEGTVSAPTGSQIQVNPYNYLVLTSNGSYTANGNVQVENLAELQIQGTTTLTGSGTLTLGGPNAVVSNYGGSSSLVTSSGFTITGSGTIFNGVGLQNNGLIVADSGDNLLVQTRAGDTNAGTILARNGGTLTLVSPDGQALSNSGLISAGSGGTLYLGPASAGGTAVISGGTVSTTGNGAIFLNSAELGNLALNNGAQGTMTIGNQTAVYFDAGLQLTNNGTFTLAPNEQNSSLIVESAMTFQNSGVINLMGLGGEFQNILYLAGDLTLAGSGTLDVDGGSLIVQLGSAHNLNNDGNTVTIGPVGDLGYPGVTGGLVHVSDYVQTAGTTIVLGTLEAQEFDLEGGDLEGVGGTIEANLDNTGGTINPGDPGPMDIEGNFTQTAGGMMVLDIDSASIFDTLSITGSANLGGALELDFQDGFVPFDGEIFDLLSFDGGETGAFSSISLEGLSGFSYTSILGSNSFSVELNANSTPEPRTWMLVLAAGIGVAFLRLRR